jgi:hypothetical protein
MAHVLLRVLSNILGVRGSDSVRESDAPLITAISESYPDLFRACGFLFALFDALSIVVKDFVEIQLPLRLGRFVLVEEYLPATVLDYFILFRIRKVISKRCFNIIYRLCASLSALNARTKNITFFLDAPNDVLFKRYHNRSSFMERELYVNLQRRLLPPLYSELLLSEVVLIDTSSNSILRMQQSLRKAVL